MMFGTQLEKYLKDNNIKKQDFAKACGISVDTVTDWLSGQPKWLTNLQNAMNYLQDKVEGFDPRELFGLPTDKIVIEKEVVKRAERQEKFISDESGINYSRLIESPKFRKLLDKLKKYADGYLYVEKKGNKPLIIDGRSEKYDRMFIDKIAEFIENCDMAEYRTRANKISKTETPESIYHELWEREQEDESEED